MTAKKTVTAAAKPTVPAEVTQVETTIDAVANDPASAAILTAAASKITPEARRVIYVVGIALGAVVTIFAAVQGTLTGSTADVTASVGGLAYSLSNLLAVLHLNVPPKA